MTAVVRQQPSIDLHHKSSMESFYSAADSTTDSFSFELPAKSQDRLKPNALRLAPVASVLQKRYQSDEEQPSPGMDEDFSDDSNSDDAFSDVEIDETIDLEEIEPFQVVSPSQPTHSVPIVFTGRPSLIDISMLAPMAKRSTRPKLGSRTPSSASIHQAALGVPIPPRSKARHQSKRSISLYEPPVVVDHVPTPKFSTPTRPAFTSSANSSVTNFSAPLRRPRPSPLGSFHISNESTDSTSSPPQLSESFSPVPSDTESDMDEGEALMQEAADIQVRTASLERERAYALGQCDFDKDTEVEAEQKDTVELDESPTPTTYQAYDPFALDPPQLAATDFSAPPRRDSTTSVASAAKKRWRGLVKSRRRGFMEA